MAENMNWVSSLVFAIACNQPNIELNLDTLTHVPINHSLQSMLQRHRHNTTQTLKYTTILVICDQVNSLPNLKCDNSDTYLMRLRMNTPWPANDA